MAENLTALVKSISKTFITGSYLLELSTKKYVITE